MNKQKEWGVAFEFRPRPELTSTEPAIDGIKTENRNFTRDDDGSSFTPGKTAMREDVLALIQATRPLFAAWYEGTRKEVQKQLRDLEIIGAIPDLGYANASYTHGTSDSWMVGQIKLLKEALRHLDLIRDRHDEFHGVEAEQ